MDAQFTAEDFPGGLRACMEAILMVADQPQHAADLARVLGVGEQEARAALERLRSQYDEEGRGFELRHTARGWQFASRAQYEQVVSAFVTDGQTARLSQAALEALAIVAYKQPVTRAQVAAIRAERSRLAAALAACPCIGQVYPSEGNFLLVKTAAPDPLYRELVAAGVIVRNRSRIAGCEGCLRITVGRPEENDRMLETVKNFRP